MEIEVEKALMINSPFLSYTDEGRVYMMEVEKAFRHLSFIVLMKGKYDGRHSVTPGPLLHYRTDGRRV